jgi:ACS family hexuronate transporter-like MFS transporter
MVGRVIREDRGAGARPLRTPETIAEDVPGAAKPAARWGWGLCWLLFASTALSYMDRQAVAVVGERLMDEFGVSNEAYGWIVAAFLLPYALLQVPAGFLADRGDVRRTYAVAVVGWSIAAMAVAWSPTLGALMMFRAFLGVGESFNWPCALRVTATVLPPADRGLGNGIFNSGAAVGAVLTPLIVAPLTAWLGWRAAFAMIGGLGFVWALAWQAAAYGPASALFLGADRPRPSGRVPRPALAAFAGLLVAAIVGGAIGFRYRGAMALWWAIAGLIVGMLLLARAMPRSWLGEDNPAAGLGRVVRLRRFWVLTVVSISINVCWHFLVNWLPNYLKTDRGMPFVVGSLLSAVPFLAADAGNLGGGAASRWLARRGFGASRARAAVMTGCVFLIAPGAMVGAIRADAWVLVLLALMALGTAAFMANYFAFCQEVDPGQTGLVVGILGALGNLFAAGFQPIVGLVKDRTGGIGPVFLVVGLLPFVGLAALLVGWGREEGDGVGAIGE